MIDQELQTENQPTKNECNQLMNAEGDFKKEIRVPADVSWQGSLEAEIKTIVHLETDGRSSPGQK